MTTDRLEKDPAYWQELLDKAFESDSEALGELCQKYLRPKLYAYALKFLEDHHNAEEVVQTLFERLVKNFQNITERSLRGFESCVITMTKNERINFLRKQKSGTSYMLNEKSLQQLAIEHLSEDVLIKLRGIKNKEVVGLKNFSDIIRRTIGSEQTKKRGYLILKYAQTWENRSEQPSEKHANPDALRSIEQREIKEFVDNDLRSVLSKEWEVVYLHYGEEFSYREISKRIGMPTTTIFNYCKKAFEKINTNDDLRARCEELLTEGNYHEQ